MAIANGTCVSFCNQPKAQLGYLRRVTPVCRCLHLFWLPGIGPLLHVKFHLDDALDTPLGQSRSTLHGWKEDSMLIKRIAACTLHVPIYLQPFPSKPVSSKVRHFCTFLHILASSTHLSLTVYEL